MCRKSASNEPSLYLNAIYDISFMEIQNYSSYLLYTVEWLYSIASGGKLIYLN